MKKGIIYLILASITWSMAQADIQKGYVRTIKRPGKKVEYISGAQISVKGIPGSFRSKNKGEFELELSPLNLATGASFSFSSVYKPGYELYDQNLSRVYSPKTPVEVILRDIKQEAKDQETFARNMFKGSEANYKKKIEALEKQLAEGKITEDKYRELFQTYQNLFDKYQSQIGVIAKRYAGLDYMDIDPVTEAINVAFSNGDYELADSLLNSLGSIDAKATAIIEGRKDSEKKKEFGAAIVSEAESELTQNRKDAERIAELLYAKYLSFFNKVQYDSAEYYIKNRVSLVPSNPRFILDAGIFLLRYRFQYSEAWEYLFAALNISMSQNGLYHPLTAESYFNLGCTCYEQNEFDWALEHLEMALEIQLNIYKEQNLNIAKTYEQIGLVYYKQRNYSDAIYYFNKSLIINNDILGKENLEYATNIENMGLLYNDLKQYGVALEYYEKALKIRLNILGNNNSSVTKIYRIIAEIHENLSDYDNALMFFAKVLKYSIDIWGEKHFIVANCHRDIGRLQYKIGAFDDALNSFNKCLNIRLGYNILSMRSFIGTSYSDIAMVYSAQGDLSNTLKYLEKALNIRLELFDENHPNVVSIKNNIKSIQDKLLEKQTEK